VRQGILSLPDRMYSSIPHRAVALGNLFSESGLASPEFPHQPCLLTVLSEECQSIGT